MAILSSSGRSNVLVVLLALSLVALACLKQSGHCSHPITRAETGGIGGALAQAEAANTTAPRIVVYYHLYAVNNWQATAADQLNKLVYSGLFEEAAVVYGCVSSPHKNISEDALSFLAMFGAKIQTIYFTPNHTAMERATLGYMRNTTMPSDLIFYFHSKGVSHPSAAQHWLLPADRTAPQAQDAASIAVSLICSILNHA